ncbi:MAG: T9SS C-terminal target domain-containing protein [Ignavibacteriae bacterium]|nr:MAG: T9SS C-terminal target domain-containing protein [Ignavibacteriota bacterium]
MKKYILITSLILLFLNIKTTNADWTQCSGIYGGTFTSFAVKGNKIFAGELNNYYVIDGGICISLDSGKSWAQTSLTNTSIRSVVISGNNIIAGGDNPSGGMYISTNDGLNWSVIYTNNEYIYPLAVSGSYVYGGTGSGIYRSTNNGLNWTKPFSGVQVNALAANNNYVFAGTSNGYYVSLDYGFSWQIFPFNYSIGSFDVRGNEILAGTAGHGVFRSSNNGLSWTPIGLDSNFVYSVVFNGNYIFASTAITRLFSAINNTDVYYTTNNGANWIKTSLSGHAVRNLKVIGNYLFAGANGSGIYMSSDNGINWVQTGIANRYINKFAVSGNNLFSACDGSGVYISTNSGASWQQTSLNNRTIFSIAINGNNIYAGSGKDNSGNWQAGIYLSTNLGVNWSQIGLTNYNVFSIAVKDNYVFAGASLFYPYNDRKLFISSNNGLNWAASSLTQMVNTIIFKDNIIFAGTENGVYTSIDNGSNWVHDNFLVGTIHSLTANGSNIFAGTTGYTFKTTNNGNNWLSTGNTNTTNTVALSSDGYFVLAATGSNGSFMTTNNGANWIQVNEGFPNPLTFFNQYSLSIYNNYAFTGTSYGLWRRPLSEFVNINNISQQLPEKYFLYQNYPNPFNPTTTIKYEIPNEGMVSLKVYDILVKEIYSSSEYKKAGSYEFKFDGSNLSSGLYFYKIEAGNFVETRRMLLIK